MARASTFVKVPMERIGVLVGPNGKTKEILEKRLQVELQIDSESGDVAIMLAPNAEDPSKLFRAKEVVLAIGRGFSPEKAFRLIEDEDSVFQIIDLREIFGRSESDIRRLKGRIIGKEGKTRKIIEELTEASLSIYGHTVGIIGSAEQVEIAKEAIEMLIEGRQHATVYKFLHAKRRELKKKKMEIWEKPQGNI
ncbi:MAG: KH domain-containing protein [Candidatus Bathyarchaeia archaeon]